MRYTLRFALAAALVLSACVSVRSDETSGKARPGSSSAFFNGKNLDGWEGLTKYWSVEDGAIVGKSGPNGVPGNTFLCSKKKYGDFEMSFKVRIKDDNGNSGVQFRSKLINDKSFVVHGPQADIGMKSWGSWGSLYGEGIGGMMKAAPAKLMKKVVKPTEFNDYSIKCVGKHVTIKVNGETMVDGDFAKMSDEGIIAFQLHAGFKNMEVTFKDFHFKDLSKK